jgi:predicted nucleic acid-binding protein
LRTSSASSAETRTAPVIVTSPYPRRPLVDSDVLIAAWTERRVEPAREDCLAFLEGVENNDGVILIAAPTVSELLKGSPSIEPPRRKSIEVVPFDRRAAWILGKDFPATALQKLRTAAGNPQGHYFKYDALIVACAKAAKADCLITLNTKDFSGLARHIGLKCQLPSAYRRPRQSKMQFPPPDETPPAGPTL